MHKTKSTIHGKKAVLYRVLPDKKVQCTACSHYCTILNGKTGICGVRKNINGQLWLLVYGKPCSVNTDPIEKKPLYHFFPGTKIFSLGTFGCNFSCEFCQNWDISQYRKPKNIGHDLPPEKIIDYCTEHNIPSIAFTYNEPSIFFEYAFDIMKLAHQKNIKTVFVSNGYMSKEATERLFGHLDAINIDLKSFNPDFYKKVCKARLEPVLDNIKKLHKAGVWVEITTLVIPGENDSKEELEQIAGFVASIDKNIPWHISAFHPDYKMKDRDSTSIQKLNKAYEIGRKAGLNFVYTGNVHSSEYQNTYCQKCSNLLIQRTWHTARNVDLLNGKCGKCGIDIPGVWQ
ncbi:MAG: AmmeMemoRadiSam system radical SAM enzyme [Candidatus Aenigmarchaeota archaeon]|nr:AmmeMemoRadiSam system radical SAM enzyme [Candidatus Aenigmarchaeota archaeon]